MFLNIKKVLMYSLSFSLATVSFGITSKVSAQENDYSISSPDTITYVNEVNSSSRRNLFSENWKFHYGEQSNAESANYDDSAWRNINLPHDYSLELPYTQQGEAESGYKLGGTGWYRKSFTISEADKDKRIAIEFGGVYMRSTVYVNGKELGFHPNGYTPFAYDITDYLNVDGENIIAVKVDHKFPSSRWYSGSGIYRDVYLTVTDDVYVAHYGVVVTDQLKDAAAKSTIVNVDTKVNNDRDEAVNAVVRQTIREKDSQSVVDTKEVATKVEAKNFANAKVALNVDNVKLWDLRNPFLYEVVTEVVINEEVVDTFVTEYGLRTFEFRADTGFYLNGEAVKLQGVSMHSDQGSLGSAAHIRAMERQVEILQDMGVNAIRVTHNPASDELIEIASRKGMLIIDEAFDGWVGYKNGNINDYSVWFDKKMGESELIDADPEMTWAEYDIKKMVKRGINSPSIISWSIGNEVMEGNSGPYDEYPNIAKQLSEWAIEVDPTRPATIGENKLKANWSEAIGMAEEINKLGGTVGFNYADGQQFDAFHAKYPEWKMYGAETSSAINSRGVYKPSNYDRHLTAYDESAVGWGARSADSWHRIITRDFMAGEFVWTGFDYLGEPTPWNGVGSGSVGQWPAPKSSYFGIVDTAGLPKDRFYFYQSQWNKDVDTLHLLPAWEESMVEINNGNVRVDVYTDAAKVELFFKGTDGVVKSLGTKELTLKTTPAGHTYRINEGTDKNGTQFRNMYLTWQVPYADGEVYAVGYDDNGNVIENAEGRSSVKTFGAAAKLDAFADRTVIDADNRDLSYITIDVKDIEGLTVDNALNLINVTVEGDGVLMALDNGDQMDHEPYDSGQRKAFNGKLVAIVKSLKEAGSFTVNIESEGLESTSVTVATQAVSDETENTVLSYEMSKNYYVKEGHQVDLAKTIKVNLTDGTQETAEIAWDPVVTNTGTVQLTGYVAKYDLTVHALVTYIETVGDILDISKVILVGSESADLPSTRPIVLDTGEILSAEFPVVWEEENPVNYAQEGLVKVNGKVNIFGDVIDVVANVRVAKQEVTVGANVAPNYLTLTQDIEKDLQSDVLEAIVDGNRGFKTVNQGSNNSVWSNYANAQAGDATAEIIFTFATAQLLGEVDLYWYQDSFASRLPKDVKFYWSLADASENDWTEITYTGGEISDNGDRPNASKATYNFDPVSAVSFKIAVESQDGVIEGSRRPALGLTEAELKVVTTALKVNDTAELESLSLNGKLVSDNVLNSKVINTEYQIAEVEAIAKDNASVTVLDEKDGVIRILVESEDQKSRSVYVINLDTPDNNLPADSDIRDYPYQKTTAEDGAHQKGAEGSGEGSAKFAVDNNLNTIFHSPWDGTDMENFWVTLELEEVTKLEGLRYLSRSGQTNGIVEKYEIYTSEDGVEWSEPIATGTWDSKLDSWSYAEFDEVVETKYIKLKALSTYGAGAQANKFMSAKEIRLRVHESGEDLSAATVTLDQDAFIYDGTAKAPTPTVVLGEKTLTKGIDYKVSYVDNVNVGEASVIIKGIVDYSGEVIAKFNISVDLEDLEALLVKAKAINAEEYTRVSFDNLQTVITEIEALLEAELTDAQLTEAIDKLTEAIENLVKVDNLDLSEIEELLAEYADIDLELYTEESVVLFETAVAEIKAELELAELQTEVDALFEELTLAKDLLEAKEVILDKSVLEAKLLELEAMNQDFYTEASYAALLEAIEAAKATLDEAVSQEELDAAVATLDSVVAALELDPTILVNEVENAKEFDKDLYTEASFDKLTVAIANAEKAIAEAVSKDELTSALEALKLAVENLVLKETQLVTSYLEAKILEAKNLREELYTEESYKDLVVAIETAENVLANAETQAEIDAAIVALQSAIDNLVLVNQGPTDPTDPTDPNKPLNPEDPTKPVKPGDSDNKPPTGVQDNLMLLVGVILISSVTLLFASKRRKEVQ